MYTFADMPDQTFEGLCAELAHGLGIAMAYFHDTLGMDSEIFQLIMIDRCPTMDGQMAWYLNFRNKHPELYL